MSLLCYGALEIVGLLLLLLLLCVTIEISQFIAAHFDRVVGYFNYILVLRGRDYQ